MAFPALPCTQLWNSFAAGLKVANTPAHRRSGSRSPHVASSTIFRAISSFSRPDPSTSLRDLQTFSYAMPMAQSFQAEKPVRSRMELCAKLELSAWRAPFHQPPQTPARLAVLKQQIENKSPGFLDLCVESCRAKGKASLPSTNQ